MYIKSILSAICILLAFATNAQKIEVEKDGLIRVDGNKAFYLVKKNATILGNSDFLFKDLEKNDIAYITSGQSQMGNYLGVVNPNGFISTGANQGNVYLCTFMKSGNQALIGNFTSLNLQKSFARTLYNAELFKNGQLDVYKERLFCLSTGGRLLSPNYAINDNDISINTAPNTGYETQPISRGEVKDVANSNEAGTSSLIINQGKIYYKKLFRAYHSKVEQTNLETNVTQFKVGFFDINNLPTYTAIYTSGQSDWIIYDNNKNQIAQILYDAQSPLTDLVQNLISNNYIK